MIIGYSDPWGNGPASSERTMRAEFQNSSANLDP